MTDYIRDAPLGQLIRFLSRNTYLQYPDEIAGFEYSEKNLASSIAENASQLQSRDERELETKNNDLEKQKQVPSLSPHPAGDDLALHLRLALADADKTPELSVLPDQKTALVNWYSSEDSENPQNWTSRKKAWVTFLIW